MFSNKYIFIYSAILVVVVAAVLASTAFSLQPFQDKNVEVEKIQNLLAAVGEPSTKENAQELYNKYFTEELAIDSKGEIVSLYKAGKKAEGQDIRPFNIDLKAQQKLHKDGKESVMPLYVYEKDGKRLYVVPLLGTGLWGPIWGNIAFSIDFNTIVGSTFDHKGETPGLGAEIANKPFQERFLGKKIFDQNNHFTSVTVKKAADKNSEHEVDALSGGTITSNGVSAMIHDCLSFYQPYIQGLKKQINN